MLKNYELKLMSKNSDCFNLYVKSLKKNSFACIFSNLIFFPKLSNVNYRSKSSVSQSKSFSQKLALITQAKRLTEILNTYKSRIEIKPFLLKKNRNVLQ